MPAPATPPSSPRPAVPGPDRPRVDVTAVLVAHDGERWLPEVLAALAAATVRPLRTVAVDTGSSDATPELLAGATGTAVDRVVTAGRRAGFGAAVAAGLEAEVDAAGGAASWLWLLHDDCAPAPDALARLLAHAADSPSAALLAPKAHDWDDPRLLVEVGLTTDRAGHRETGLERREPDQGQHDAVRDVLATGTAAALVRRDVWDTLGGLDPGLPVFRDDLDLGWRVNAAGHRVVVVPAATVRHALAATRGQRRLHAVRGRAGSVDRRHALFVLLAHAPAARLPLLAARLAVATVVRALGFLLTRRPVRAADELAAAAAVLLHPGTLRAARRDRARTRTLPAKALGPLFAHRRARARADMVRDWLAGTAPSAHARVDGSEAGAAASSGSGTGGTGVLRHLLVRPPRLLALGLLLVALLAERRLLPPGAGGPAGGRLLPPPGGAGDLWRAYAAAWHPVSVGSDLPAPPLLAVLAAVSTVLLGKAWLAVDLLLLGSIPLAGVTAYAAARSVVRHRALRVWAAATWALLPVATGAVAAGRLDAAAAQVGLPLLLPACARLLHDDPYAVGWRRAWAAGLGLALLAAFDPVLVPLLALPLLVGAGAGLARAAGRPALRRLGAVLVTLAVPVGVLLPWSATLLSPAARLLHGPGRVAPDPALADPALPGWHLVLLSPGGAGLPPAWLGAGLLLAALGGVLRAERRALALGGWALALTGLVTAVGLARTTAQGAAVWPGAPLQLAAAGLLLAALVGADGTRSRLAAADFGWRQVTAGAVAVLAALLPVLAAASFVGAGAGGPLAPGGATALPAFAQSELAAEPGLRVLLLRPGDGRVGYTLTGAGGPRLGAADLPPSAAQVRRLDAVVGDLLSATGADAVGALATRAVRYVALPATAPGDLAAALDAQPGLVRRARGAVLLWQVTAPAARLTLLPPELAEQALLGDPAPDPDLLRGFPSRPLEDVVPPGPAGRLLVLSAAVDPGWRATLDGRPLPRRTAWGWASAFAVPAEGGALRVTHARTGRRVTLLLQAVGLLVVVVLAGPGAPRRAGPDVSSRPRHARSGAR